MLRSVARGMQMSKPRYRWWGYVRNVLRAYPALREEYEAMHEQRITANYSSEPRGGGSNGRALEDLALRELMPQDQREFLAVQKTIDATMQMPGGEERVAFIRAIYFGKTQKRISDVFPKFHIAEATAWRWHGDFIRLVATHLGLRN